MADLFGMSSDAGERSRARRARRERTPAVLQMEAVECGAACLAMILAYHGRWVPLDRLRKECGVSRDGSKAGYVVKAAEHYGLVSKGLKRSLEDLKTLPFPLIAFWELDHFVVVEGYDRKGWYLNDPAVGPRTVDIEEFDKSFTGVCLTFEKGPGFVPGGRRPSLIRSLMARARGMRDAVFYAILAGLCLTIIGLVIPTFLKVYVDHYLIDRDPHWLKPLLWIMLLTVIVQTAVTWLQQNVLLRLNTKLALSISTRFFRHMLRLPTEFFAQRYGGELQSRMALNDRVAGLLSGELPATVLHCMTAVFFVAVMVNYSVVLTAIGVAGAVINLGVLALMSRKLKDRSKRLLQQQGKLTGVSTTGLAGMETIKSTGGELDFFRRWAGYQAQSGNSSQELSVWSSLAGRVPDILSSLNSTVIMALGGLWVMRGFLTIGDFIAFQALMASFAAPVNNLVGMGAQLQQLEAALFRLDDVMDNEEDPLLAKVEQVRLLPDAQPKLNGKIEFRDVSFAYAVFDEPFIDKFGLTVNPGSRVALVGSSGCGKTTIANLAAGLYEPGEGEILFDGKPRSEIPRAVMANSLAKVDQDILLFEGSIRENLVLWNESIPQEVMVTAAKDALIHDEIIERPDGYRSLVLEGGRNFSGGQRQRLEIARALAVEPTILVLDEATSALDPVMEQAIDENIRRRGCTCLIAAHRLSTIRDCDEIIVLDAGKAVERGTHEQLMELNGRYATLVKDA